jgi:hypothetical protein
VISLPQPRLPAAALTPSFTAAVSLLCLVFVAACSNSAPHADPPARSATPAASSSSGPTAIVAAPADAAPADAAGDLDAALVDAGSDPADAATDAASNDADAAPAKRAFVADNKVLPPLESDDLNQKAKKLLDAIISDDPALGESFWFPKEPFIPLKDVKGPDKYWNNLHATYARDIHALHRKRKSWEGATFVSFKMGSTPKWVPPGDEANKIGYYRSFRGKLTYLLEGKKGTIEVHTIISWQGDWFITHLSKFKKK